MDLNVVPTHTFYTMSVKHESLWVYSMRVSEGRGSVYIYISPICLLVCRCRCRNSRLALNLEGGDHMTEREEWDMDSN